MERIMNLEKCKKGKHPLIEISRISLGYDEEKVVRWCPQCGAIVADLEVDGRLFPGEYLKMRIPKITKEMG